MLVACVEYKYRNNTVIVISTCPQDCYLILSSSTMDKKHDFFEFKITINFEIFVNFEFFVNGR